MKPVSQYIEEAEAALQEAHRSEYGSPVHDHFMGEAIANANLAAATATLLAAGVIQ